MSANHLPALSSTPACRSARGGTIAGDCNARAGFLWLMVTRPAHDALPSASNSGCRELDKAKRGARRSERLALAPELAGPIGVPLPRPERRQRELAPAGPQ